MYLYLLLLILSTFTQDYYKILGVDKGITNKRLEKAYKKKLLSLHPDKFKT